MRVNESLKLRVLTVAGEGVLGQVVGADAEEIHHRREPVAYDSCRGSLDHYADLGILAELYAVIPKLVLDLLAHSYALLHLGNAGYHREHYSQISECRGSVKGTELSAEDLGPGQADPYRAEAQRGIVLFFEVEIIYLLVGTDVEGADDDLFARHALEHLAVGGELLLLRRVILALEIKELTAEQTYAARIVSEHRADPADAADVGVDVHLSTVESNVLLALELLEQLLLPDVRRLLFLKALDGLLIGRKEHLSRMTVHGNKAAVLDSL